MSRIRPGEAWGGAKWTCLVLEQAPPWGHKPQWRCLILHDEQNPEAVGALEDILEEDMLDVAWRVAERA